MGDLRQVVPPQFWPRMESNSSARSAEMVEVFIVTRIIDRKVGDAVRERLNKQQRLSVEREVSLVDYTVAGGECGTAA